jgi:hypothetical protein
MSLLTRVATAALGDVVGLAKLGVLAAPTLAGGLLWAGSASIAPPLQDAMLATAAAVMTNLAGRSTFSVDHDRTLRLRNSWGKMRETTPSAACSCHLAWGA